MSLLSDAKEVRSAIAAIVRDEIERQTGDCLRVRKAIVQTAPNGSVCGVQLMGDLNRNGTPKVINLPYSSLPMVGATCSSTHSCSASSIRPCARLRLSRFSVLPIGMDS